MIDSLHFKYSVEYKELKWERFEKIKGKKGVYKAETDTILLNYYKYSKTLVIILNAHRILKKFDIQLADIHILQEKIEQAIIQVVENFDKENLELLRCDFCA